MVLGLIDSLNCICRFSVGKFQKICSRMSWSHCLKNVVQFGIWDWWWIPWRVPTEDMLLSLSQPGKRRNKLSERYVSILQNIFVFILKTKQEPFLADNHCYPGLAFDLFIYILFTKLLQNSLLLPNSAFFRHVYNFQSNSIIPILKFTTTNLI